MPALTIDGLASAALLPAHTNELLDTYSTDLAQMALKQQRVKSVAIADLLGLIVVTDEEECVGVAIASEVTAELLADVSERDRGRLAVFLARPVPPTHLRVVVWDGSGIAMLRMDTEPMPAEGQA